jgi:dTDP-4-amino-4,6-dideoxygalactose transaminase
MIWKIPLFDLSYDEKESAAVQAVLDSKWLSSGPNVQKFEDNFAQYLGEETKCCAVSNCTAALHMALLTIDIKPGDEVIVSGLTFVAALNMIMVTGATPVLADSESFDDWNVSAEDISVKITDKTKAIIIVHFAGYPCNMDEILAIAKKHKIILIEDVAHAIGAEYRGKKCGTLGDIACFSFFSNKNLSTGEGGMFVTKNKIFDEKARLLRSHGMTSMTIDRHEGKTISYDVVQPGLNYRLDEIRAALGIVQLSKLDHNNRKRHELVNLYMGLLSSENGLIIPWSQTSDLTKSSYHIFPVLLPESVERSSIMNALMKEGIQTSIHYPAFNKFSFFESVIEEKLPIADKISDRVLTLPLYPDMSPEAVHEVCKQLRLSLIKYQGQ